jgi:uncharacterized protein YciI
MQFIVIAYDGTDGNAPGRRLAVREEHLKFAEELYRSGRWLYASAILDDEEKMIGSMVVCDFASREELQRKWLDKEPYVRGDVWRKIEIRRARVPSFCMKEQ